MPIHSLKEDGRPATQWYWDDWFASHDVQSCSWAAQGLWMNLCGIMFSSEIRGTLAVNGNKLDNKSIAKRFGHKITEVNKLITELEVARVFSRLEDGTIISRRMYRESLRQQEISQKRAEAGKAGMAKRWGDEDNKGITSPDNKKITKITASTSSSTSSSSSSSNKEVVEEGITRNEPILFSFETKQWTGISDADMVGWQEAYPACVLRTEFAKMREWLLANPEKRKKNYRRFITNWLSRAQDQGGTRGRKPEHKPDAGLPSRDVFRIAYEKRKQAEAAKE